MIHQSRWKYTVCASVLIPYQYIQASREEEEASHNEEMMKLVKRGSINKDEVSHNDICHSEMEFVKCSTMSAIEAVTV